MAAQSGTNMGFPSHHWGDNYRRQPMPEPYDWSKHKKVSLDAINSVKVGINKMLEDSQAKTDAFIKKNHLEPPPTPITYISPLTNVEYHLTSWYQHRSMEPAEVLTHKALHLKERSSPFELDYAKHRRAHGRKERAMAAEAARRAQEELAARQKAEHDRRVKKAQRIALEQAEKAYAEDYLRRCKINAQMIMDEVDREAAEKAMESQALETQRLAETKKEQDAAMAAKLNILPDDATDDELESVDGEFTDSEDMEDTVEEKLEEEHAEGTDLCDNKKRKMTEAEEAEERPMTKKVKLSQEPAELYEVTVEYADHEMPLDFDFDDDDDEGEEYHGSNADIEM